MPSRVDSKIVHAVSRIEEILATNIFVAPYHPLLQSAFIELLIRLNDLMQKANSLGARISFTDDVAIYPGVRDITDAVRECRAAVCHMYVNSTFITQDGLPARRGKTAGCSELSFAIVRGQIVLLQTPRYTITSDYQDDICFFYGAHKLYLKRHIVRALEEAKAILMPDGP